MDERAPARKLRPTDVGVEQRDPVPDDHPLYAPARPCTELHRTTLPYPAHRVFRHEIRNPSPYRTARSSRELRGWHQAPGTSTSPPRRKAPESSIQAPSRPPEHLLLGRCGDAVR